MLPNFFTAGFIGAAVVAAGAAYAIDTGKLTFNGRFLGIAEDTSGWDWIADPLKGATILTAALVARSLISKSFG